MIGIKESAATWVRLVVLGRGEAETGFDHLRLRGWMSELKAEKPYQLQHYGVFRKDRSKDCVHAVSLCPREQPLHQVDGKTMALQLVLDGNREFGDVRIALTGKPRDADDLSLRLTHGGQRHVALVVEAREFDELLGCQLPNRGKETELDLLG